MKEADSVFNPAFQQKNLDAKLIIALERMSEVFRAALWEAGKPFRLSPLQIQILLFVRFHPAESSTVSNLAREFNLRKPTISEAVRTLLAKELIEKLPAPLDTRSYFIRLTKAGTQTVRQLNGFTEKIQLVMGSVEDAAKGAFYQQLLNLLSQFQRHGLIQQQRSCHQCEFYRSSEDGDHCDLLKTALKPVDLRIDCPEFQPQTPVDSHSA